jgi:hypothetical protein
LEVDEAAIGAFDDVPPVDRVLLQRRVPLAVALRTGAVEDAAVQHPPAPRLPINAVSAMGKK